MSHRLSPSETKLLTLFLERLEARAPAGTVECVKVFGSRARGDSNENSDLDVAVMLNEGVAQYPAQRIVSDAQVDAVEALDAWDLGLAALAIPAGPQTGIRDAIARDGREIWPRPVWLHPW